MKKIFLFIFVFFLTSKFAYSQVLFEENFVYPAGDSLQMHGWVVHSGATGPWTVVTPGLTFPTYPFSGIGNAAQTDADGFQDVNKNFAEQTEGTIYGSMMVSVINATTTGDYFYHIGNTSLGNTFRGKVFARDDGSGNLNFGISKVDNSPTAIYETTSRSYNTNYLLVMKYEFIPSDPDLVSLYIFDSDLPMTEPSSPTLGPDDRGGNLINAGTIALRQGTTGQRPQLIIDGLIIGRAWTDVVMNIEQISEIADGFKLLLNYPNPFNPTTNIRFSLPSNGFTTLKVFNMLGQVVSTLVNTRLLMGVHEVPFIASGLPSGVYFYNIEFEGNDGSVYRDTKKLILTK